MPEINKHCLKDWGIFLRGVGTVLIGFAKICSFFCIFLALINTSIDKAVNTLSHLEPEIFTVNPVKYSVADVMTSKLKCNDSILTTPENKVP